MSQILNCTKTLITKINELFHVNGKRDKFHLQTHTWDINSFRFFPPRKFGGKQQSRWYSVAIVNLWKQRRIDIAFAVFPHCPHVKLFSATRRREKRACHRRRRRSRDSSAMIRADRRSRTRTVTHGSPTRQSLHRRKSFIKTPKTSPAPRNGRDLSLCQTRSDPGSPARRSRAPCVYAHVTPVTKLLINAILSRRRHYAIDPRLTSIRRRVL